MKYILPVAFMLCSCEPPYECYPPNFYAGGMCVYSEMEVDPEEISMIVDTLEKEVRAKGYDEVYDLEEHLRANNVQLEFIDSHLSMGCERHAREVYTCDLHIGGVNYDGVEIYVKYEECLGISALAHEVLHSVESIYLDGMVGDHMTPWFFEEYAEGNYDIWWQTVEVRMWRLMTCSLDSCAHENFGWTCEDIEEDDSDWSVPFKYTEKEEDPKERIELPDWGR